MDPLNPQFIRNFSVIAHIDHGKSTLADRFLEFTGALQAREMEAQVLDSMDLERERGITIKAHPVRLHYKAKDGNEYVLNLIDTPGHVDFSYEVTRSLAACEGALLLVDASQGVEAQTLANAYLAVDNNLEIIPVINKIDLPGAQPDEARRQIEEIIGLDATGAILASAKEGTGTEEILEAIVARLPPPIGDSDAPLKALIFDSWYDSYRGVVIVVRVLEGTVKAGTKVRFMASAQDYPIESLGVFLPKSTPVEELGPGEVGFLTANIKNVRDAQIGDTVTETARQTAEAFPGFKELRPMVFAGLYPVEGHEYRRVARGAREAAVQRQLALLRARDVDGSRLRVPLRLPRPAAHGDRPGTPRARVRHGPGDDRTWRAVPGHDDRWTACTRSTARPSCRTRAASRSSRSRSSPPPILTPSEFVGGILQLCQDKRGVQKGLEYLSSDRVLVTYELPFAEVVLDFYDKLKTLSRGYASLDYHVTGFWESPLVKMDILVNGDAVDALSLILHRESAYERGKALVAKMRQLIPRQMFEVAIQAAIGTRIIARESVKALRKNVLAKCYGGDISRKRKLLEKQKEGKKRMKRVGQVDIPQEAFLRGVERGVGRDHGNDTSEIDAARVLRVDRHRGHPRALHPHVRRAGVQDPDRLDGEQPPRRRPPAREQVRVRPVRLQPGAEAAAGNPDQAR